MSVRRAATVFGVLLAIVGSFADVTSGDPLPSSSPSEADPTETAEATREPPTASPPPPTPTPLPSPVPTSTPTPLPTTPPIGPRAPLVYSGPRNAPVIALTIDDCWSDPVVLEILRILQRERVNATFFPIGQSVPDNAGVWQQVSAAGFPVANHTWSHANLTGLTLDQIVAEIRAFDSRVSAVIGRSVMPVVRPPGGAWNDTVLRAAAAANQRSVVIWDTSFGDSGRGSVDDLVRNATRGRWGSIVLMHANQERSALALPAVITYYRAHGYQFVTIGQLLGVAGPVPFGPGVSPPTAAPTSAPTPIPPPSPTSPGPRPTPATTPIELPTVEPSAAPSTPAEPDASWIDTYGATLLLALGTAGVAAGAAAGWWYANHR